MKELREYRENLIARLGKAADEFRDACLARTDPFASIDGGWNAHQIAVHTRDVDRHVYGARARQTAAEDNPEFQSFDGDSYMAQHYSASEPLNKVLEELVGNVQSLVELLRGLPAQAWSRESRHTTLGRGFTLQAWVERDLAHIEEHLATIRKHNS